MKDNLSRLMLCLAALELTDSQLRILLDEFKTLSWEEARMQVLSLRQQSQHFLVKEDVSRLKSVSSSNQFFDLTIGVRVEQLLRTEAGLSATQASDLLSSRLVELGMIERNDLPSVSRKSFENWVARLALRVSSKDILMCATIIRNEYVHKPMRDWTLSNNNK